MKTFEFGSDGSMIGTITRPREGIPEVGVILFGMGVAELMAARQFARSGFVAMQIRILKDPAAYNNFDRLNAAYSASGISLCREAMDALSKECNVHKFILMGNCAAANVSFNTALEDPRVQGLILTNPLVSATAMTGMLYRHNLFRFESWRRLLTGQSKVFSRVISAMTTKRSQTNDGRPEASTAQRDHMELPLDFEAKLQLLLNGRDLRALVFFAHTEPSLKYFQKYYSRLFRMPVATDKLWFEIMTRDTHVFSTDDDAAKLLNDVIIRWTGSMFLSAASQVGHGLSSAAAAILPAGDVKTVGEVALS